MGRLQLDIDEADRPHTAVGLLLYALSFVGALTVCALIVLAIGQPTVEGGRFLIGIFVLSFFVLRFAVLAFIPAVLDARRVRREEAEARRPL